jgi:hypothetical protein
MAGPLTSQEKSRELYRLVRECCDQRRDKRCDGKCAYCRLNIHLYCDDVREATLIKTSAEIDWAKAEGDRKGDQFVGWLKFGLVAIIVIVVIAMCSSCAAYEAFLKVAHDTFYGNSPPPSAVSYQTVTSQFDIDTYNAAIAVSKNAHDVNGDGVIQCIDRALLFRQYYRDGQTAHLMWHFDAYYNATFKVWAERLNHLYVRVYDDYGVAWDIEPLSKNKDINKRTVQYYWGSKYNPSLVRNVTQHVVQIRNGTHRWVW